MTPTRYTFGPFAFEPAERLLLRDGEPVRAWPQTLDLLEVFLRHPGRLLTRDELMGALWPDTLAEDNALTVALSKLRHALGDAGRRGAYLETVSRRGYRFVAPVEVTAGPGATPPAYLQARYHWARRTEGQVGDALAGFEAAAEADPTFAPAWVGIAEAAILLPHLAGTPPREASPRARRAAERALALAPGDPSALVALAYVTWRYDWDVPEAERLLTRALAADPEHVGANQALGMLLGLNARPDAGLAILERILALDPDSLEGRMDLGHVSYFARRFEASESHMREVIRRAPGHPMAHIFLGLALEGQGQEAEARAAIEAAVRLGGPHPVPLAKLARAQARAGATDDARALLAEIERQGERAFIHPIQLAPVYDALGDRDAAFGALARAVELRDPMLIYLATDPHLDPLRDEPRFRALAWGVGLDATPATT
jgi:DNA-binding winged helix-turn-helix (wHTH) protein